MKAKQKYRFKIANLCDVAATYTVTEIGQFGTTNLVIGAHDFVAGEYAYFESNDPAINGYRAIVSVDATTVRILITATVDTSILGTIKKINVRSIKPLNFYDTKYQWNQERDEIFFRKQLNGGLKLIGDDFIYFRDNILTNECCEVKFIAEKFCTGLDVPDSEDREPGEEWEVDWTGYFTHNSCEWNLSHCEVIVTPEVDDAYRCLFYSYEDKQTIFDTLTYFERLECCEDRNQVAQGGSSCDPPCVGLLDFMVDAGSDVIGFDNSQKLMPCDGSDFNEWQIEKHTTEQITFTNEPVETFHICCTFIREVAITLDAGGVAVEPAGDGWTMREEVNYNGLPAHKWTRLPYGGIYYVFSSYTVVRDCDGTPCIRTWTLNLPETPDSTTTQKSLEEVATLLIGASCGTVNGFRSDFFEINPPGDTPGYVAGVNYVTGAANQITNLRVQQISAFLTIVSESTLEIYSDMSLKDLLDSLKILFNTKWFVDDDDYLRMEHISWFERTGTIDTTTGSLNIRLNKAKQHFKYDRVEIPVREKFTCVYQGYKDFVGTDIKYNSACVNLKKTITYSVPKFSTDLKHIRGNASEFKDFNSFLLLACDTDDTVLSETGELTGELQENGHLSWANLHENYYRHDRYLLDGTMNDVETDFESAKKLKRQVPVQYGSTGCCKRINPLLDLVTTELGDGQIDKMEKDNRTELFTIELLY